MSKIVRTFIFAFLFLQKTYASIYLEKLSEYRKNIHLQLNEIVMPQIQISNLDPQKKERLRQILNRLSLQVDKVTTEFEDLYQSTYEPKSSGEALQSNVLQRREEQFAVQIERVFRNIFYFLEGLERRSFLEKRIKNIESEIEDLEHSVMKWKPSVDFRLWMEQFFPIRKHRLSLLAQAASNLLPLPWKTTQIERLEKTPLKKFLRNDAEIQMPVIQKDQISSGPSILLLTINHEHGIFELRLAIELLRRFGADKIFLLTARHAWPKFAKNKKQEFSLIFPEDGDPAKQLQGRIAGSDRVGVIVCPEGLLPMTHTGLPLSVKPGAFVMARKLAQRMSSTSVYWISTKYNGLEVLTSEEKIPVRVEISALEKVPSSPLSKPDSWVNSRRVSYEDWVNETRGGHIQIDLVRRTYVPETDLPAAGSLQTCIQKIKQLSR